MKPLGTGDPLRLGPYRLIGVLGAGGMGKVYLGRDSAGRPAAIKVLRPELAHQSNLAQRFVREAHAAQAVQSPGVARVLGAETEGGRPWIACEFLAGPTLAEAVERYGPLDGTALRAVGAALASTLADIHAAGLVHRDVKPPNIVLTAAGPRIIDFGIARPEHGLTLTSTGEAPVTPGYGPPEQVLGQRVGPPADVFALGAVLTLAATGQTAYRGSHVAAVQYEVVHGEPRLEGLPPDLYPLIAPCLAKDPAYRPTPPQIAAALAPPPGAEAVWRQGPLAEDIAGREHEAGRLAALPAAGDTQVPGPSRRRLLVGLGAGGAEVAASAGTAAWWFLGKDDGGTTTRPKRDPWAARRLNSYSAGSAPAPLWGPVGGLNSDSPLVLPLHQVLVVAMADGSLAGLDIRTGKEKWRQDSAVAAAGAAALDANTFAAADAEGALYGLRGRDRREQWSAPDARAAVVLAGDADGAYVTTKDGELRAVGADGRERWTVESPVGSSVGKPAWATTAGGTLVLSGSDGRLAVVDTGSGDTVWDTPKRSSYALPCAVGGGFVYAGGDGLTAYALKGDGKPEWNEKPKGEYIWSAPALDGDLLFAVNDLVLTAMNTKTRETEFTAKALAVALKYPPVVQGNSVWCGTTENIDPDALKVYDIGKGRMAWDDRRTSRERDDWTIAAANNRVFVLYTGSLTANPVF
ncbi:protein kinase domain-containing protein [Streptomyces synnematoformans]|uniref:Protein kinase domain-containing protein n=1 Tax=Streptomyces synnematoformans TaxID=415721 RepID=A0ABN2A1I9_9ACTN